MAYSDETILAYALGELSAPEADSLKNDAERDPGLAARISAARALTRRMPQSIDDPAFVVSARARQALLSIGSSSQNASANAGPLKGLVARISAALRLDTAAGPTLAPGFRGSTAERFLSYSFDAGSVDIRVEPEPNGRFVLTGRFEGQRVPLEVSAIGPNQLVSRIDAEGFFELDLSPGVWDISLLDSDTELALPPLQLGDTG